MNEKIKNNNKQAPTNEEILTEKLYKNTLVNLGEMLKILKQGDNKETRNKIKSHCQNISHLGQKIRLLGWTELLETASVAIADTNNSYTTTTKLIIKEIKQAAEDVVTGKTKKIYISSELQSLVPDSFLKMVDLETIYGDINKPEIGYDTINRDLWKDSKVTIAMKQDKEQTYTNQISEEEIKINDSLSEEISPNLLDDFNNVNESESMTDWFDEDYFDNENEEDGEDNSAVFLREQGSITLTNYPESLEDINSLFEDQPQEKLTNWDETEKSLTANKDEDWDLFDDLEVENIDNETGQENDDLEDDLFDILDELEDNYDDNSHADYDGVNTEVQCTIGDFGITTDERPSRQEIDEIFKGTLIIDDDDYDDEIPDSIRAARIVSQNLELLPIIYDNFEELEKVIEADSWLETNKSWAELEFLAEDLTLYYENFEELDKIITGEITTKISVNWQELTNLIDDQFKEIQITRTSKTERETREEQIVEQELSDLDQLLVQAQSSSTKPQWQGKLAKSEPQLQKKPFEQTMRVPVKQLDSLNNLVGEMVVRRNRLEEDQDRLRQFLDNLLGHVQKLSDVGSRMQDLYERSLLEGALLASREKNQATVREQLERAQKNTNTVYPNTNKNAGHELDELELDRFTGFHLISQEIIELIVRVRESTSDIQFLVDETEQLGRNLRQVTTQLQEEINKSRMVAFAQTADRLPRAVRDISLSYDKDIELKVEGREVLIDKMILEHLWDPIQQLVKNSITHGIEVPEIRKAMGKPTQGTITIRTFLQGPQTVISVSDDGAGIDPNKVKQKAIEKQLITKAQSANVTTQDLYDFLFHAGFSTKDKADSHAGRGVGLDIVRSKLNEIRGTVGIDSHLGQGTTFTIRLPLTLSIGKALCCLNDNARIAFPMDGIEDTKDYTSKDIVINPQGQKCITWQNKLLPFRPLSSLLTYNRQITRSIIYASGNDDEIISIVILRGGNNLLAVQVDQVIGEEEIVIKQISGPLPKPKGIAGATVRSDGIVMPIGDVIELIDIAQGNIAKTVVMDMFPSRGLNNQTLIDIPVKAQPLVLIVDDSITVREMLSISFNKAGYLVEQARDGLEAWQKLRAGLPCDIVFCDIEMPRMNGLELLKNIQEDEFLSEIPVAILSSRGADKHQKIAAELGASAYLIKPYVEKDLIDSAKRMVEGEVLLFGSSKKSIKASKRQEIEKPKEIQHHRQQKRKKAPMVLIIDDSVVVREMLSMTFNKAGYQVEQARDGQDGWDKVSGGLPCDIILCDIEMPRMNGLELLARMQQDERLASIPVAMVTSRGAEKHRKIAADLGAKAYFTKPYLEEELLEATNRLIQGEVLLNAV